MHDAGNKKKTWVVSNPGFLPRVEWSIRTGLAAAFMSALAFSPSTEGSLLLPGFGAFVAVMTVELTLGKTTVNVVGKIDKRYSR